LVERFFGKTQTQGRFLEHSGSYSMAVRIDLSSGTNRLTRPIFSASFASTVLPESKISAARELPASLGKK
jgi:hypothetical protein